MSTISEGISFLKTLGDRKSELTTLRNQSATRRFQATNYGTTEVAGTAVEPVYNTLELDKTIVRINREERLLNNAIKKANASTEIEYKIDDTVLGELV